MEHNEADRHDEQMMRREVAVAEVQIMLVHMQMGNPAEIDNRQGAEGKNSEKRQKITQC